MPNASMRAAPRYCPTGRLLFRNSGRLLKAAPMPTLMTVMTASAAVEPIKLRHFPTCVFKLISGFAVVMKASKRYQL